MRLFWITAAVALGLDQLSKLGVLYGLDLLTRGDIDILPPYVNFRLQWNYGINFGLMSHGSDLARWALIGLALAICAWVIWWIRRESGNRLAMLSGGMLLGGALGNVIDRAYHRAVVDFLNMSCCGIENPYSFNIADVAIFAGAIGLVLFGGKDAKPGKPARTKR